MTNKAAIRKLAKELVDAITSCGFSENKLAVAESIVRRILEDK